MNQRVVAVLMVCFALLLGCRHHGPTVDSASASGTKTLYLKCNIHAQDKGRMPQGSYSNWTLTPQHYMIPVNTPVEIGDFKNGFSILPRDGKRGVNFIYNRHAMQMDEDAYLKLITSQTPVNIAEFSEIDRKGITEGKSYVGMSKKGIMTALGYPAAHRTPSLESNTWVYWKGRAVAYSIEFDDKGFVKVIRDR